MNLYRITVTATKTPPRPYCKTMRLDSDLAGIEAAVNIWYRRRVRWRLSTRQCACTLARFDSTTGEYDVIAKWGR